MEDEQGLLDKARRFGSRIESSTKENENVLIVSHHDADGIAASAVLSDFIERNHGHCQIRTVGEPSSRFFDRIDLSKFDVIIFLDICSGLSKELSKRFGDRWMVIDHHEIPDSEKKSDKILNAYQFGFDGTNSVSTAGLSYLAVKPFRDRTCFFAVVGALGDRQDIGPRRSLIGLNAKMLEDDAQGRKSISTKYDLLLWARESKPIHESLANSVGIYIPGLTGNRDACLASLRGAGIEIKVGTRWKTASDFNEDERQKLLETVAPHLSGSTYTIEDLVGSVYSLNEKDEFSSMRDARDLALILNACGRMGRPSAGISMCLGENPDLSNEVDQIVSEYRLELTRTIQNLSSSEDRISEKSDYALVTGDGLVRERMTGAVCQIVSAYSRFKNKVVLVRTTTADGDVKASAREGKERTDYNLGEIMRQIGEATAGVGGGLRNAAGARFSIAKQQEFQQAADSIFQNRKQS
jgi:single-stranded-DNA-specific exonuclease